MLWTFLFGVLGYGCLWQVSLGHFELVPILLFGFICYWFAVD